MAKGIAHLGILCSLTLLANVSQAASLSALLISEVMVNPATVSDTRGEWFELFNPTDQEFNLRDISIGDDGSDRHRIETDLLILPGHFLTLARNGDVTLNGGFDPDYVYDSFTLSNSVDEIVLSDGPAELLRLDYGSGFAVAGQSRELLGTPMAAENYGLTLAGLTYGLGDIGTPGAPGSTSLAPSAVPLPAAAWLFISGLLAVFSPTVFLRRVKTITDSAVTPRHPAVIPQRSAVTPSHSAAIPGPSAVIPRLDPIRRTGGIQS